MKWLSTFSMTLLFTLTCIGQSSWPIGQFHGIEKSRQITVKQMTSQERASVLRPLCRIAEIDHCGDNALSASYQFARAALNNTGKDSLIVQGMGSFLCGASGNCAFIIFDNAGRILLNTYGVQGFAITKDLSNGRVDIVTSQHGSANESTLRRFRFDGHHYRSLKCADLLFDLDHPNRPPRIKTISCANGPEER